jgi:hypothetical protein
MKVLGGGSGGASGLSQLNGGVEKAKGQKLELLRCRFNSELGASSTSSILASRYVRDHESHRSTTF